jgi:hypothetical protein
MISSYLHIVYTINAYSFMCRESTEQLFSAAPFMEYFSGQDLMVAFTALEELYAAVFSTVPDDPDPGGVVCADDVNEVEWTIRPRKHIDSEQKENLSNTSSTDSNTPLKEGCGGGCRSPEWKVVWALISRSKLRPGKYQQPVKNDTVTESKLPSPLFDVTKVMPGAIVYVMSDMNTNPTYAVKAFLKDR